MICQLIKLLGGGFESLIFVVSVFQMLCIYRAIMLYSPYKVMSLLILYPTIYLTYFCSGLRQGIVAAFFLGFMVEWLLEHKWLSYIIACIILSTIHSSSLILLVLLLVRELRIKELYLCLAGALMFGCFVYFTPTSFFSFIDIGSFQNQIQNISISYIGLIERIIMFIIITGVYRNFEMSNEHIDHIQILYKIYFAGFIISVACFPWGLVSSRLPMVMKAVEVILIPMLLKGNRMYRQVLVAFMVCYSLLMTTKNISTYIGQGEYTAYNVVTYPYLNIGDKDFAHQVRSRNKNLQLMIKDGVIQ